MSRNGASTSSSSVLDHDLVGTSTHRSGREKFFRLLLIIHRYAISSLPLGLAMSFTNAITPTVSNPNFVYRNATDPLRNLLARNLNQPRTCTASSPRQSSSLLLPVCKAMSRNQSPTSVPASKSCAASTIKGSAAIFRFPFQGCDCISQTFTPRYGP